MTSENHYYRACLTNIHSHAKLREIGRYSGSLLINPGVFERFIYPAEVVEPLVVSRIDVLQYAVLRRDPDHRARTLPTAHRVCERLGDYRGCRGSDVVPEALVVERLNRQLQFVPSGVASLTAPHR